MSDRILTLNIKIDDFNMFLSYIKELSLIDPTIILSIDDENIMIYSFVGKDINDIHAFKTVITRTNELFNKPKNLDKKVIFIIKDGKKLSRNLQNFLDYGEDIKIKLSYNDDDQYCNYLNIFNTKLKIKEISGDPILMSKDITMDDIDFLTNKDNSLLNFTITELDFKKIKNLSNIDITNDILYININEKELSIGENKWDLKICDIDKPNLSVSFPKRYFKNLKFKDNTKVYLFETYILVSDENSDLMIVLETSV